MGKASRSKRNRRDHTPATRTPWYFPVLFGAGFLFIVVGLRVLFALAMRPGSGRDTSNYLLAPLVAAFAGAAAGLIYSVIGTRLLRIRRFGRYAAGVVTMLAYLFAAFFAIWYVDASSLEELSAYPVMAAFSIAAVAIGFGIYLGHTWFHEPA